MHFETNRKRTILIVDDVKENLIILGQLLSDEYELAIAKSGEKALEILNDRSDIDLILLDIIMPGGIDGYEVCDRIKKNEVHKNIPIIFLTGLSDAEDETKGLELGGADYITKPLHPDVVKARINTQLNLLEEKEKSQTLLEILLPKNVIDELNQNGFYTPVIHEDISILFCDLVGFTETTTKIPADQLVSELSDIFSTFDQIITNNNCMRIKTIGDGYMAVCGVVENINHADCLVQSGLEMIKFLNSRLATIRWKCRVGINSGKAISGVIGKQRFQFDLLGDDVNLASRVESKAPEMKLTITKSTLDRIAQDKYLIDSIGLQYLKGKGDLELFTISERI